MPQAVELVGLCAVGFVCRGGSREVALTLRLFMMLLCLNGLALNEVGRSRSCGDMFALQTILGGTIERVLDDAAPQQVGQKPV